MDSIPIFTGIYSLFIRTLRYWKRTLKSGTIWWPSHHGTTQTNYMPTYMTAIDGLVRRVSADVRKSWVDYFKNIERLQIRDAFDAGIIHANETPKALQLTGTDYYRELFQSGGEDPYPVDKVQIDE